MRTFVFGAFVGAMAMWVWGDQMRSRFSGQIDGVVDRVLGVLDGLEDGLDTLRTRIDGLASTSTGTSDRREARNISAGSA